jgi:diguanylate cyclase (GGDEF)-like protein
METSTTNIPTALVGPAILSVFALGFVWVWSIAKRRPHPLLLAAACILFAVGASSQTLHWPADPGPNAMASGLAYTLAVLAACQGILLRSGKTLRLGLALGFLAAIMGLLWYFFYVERNLTARIYIQNFGYGAVLLATALHLLPGRRTRTIDRVLFWVLLICALQFFPRTILTMGLSDISNVTAFSQSLFWQVLQLSLAIVGAGLALTILAATVTDLMDELRRERDGDGLTGVLNRRGFEEQAAKLLAGNGQGVLILCDLDHFKGINDTYGHDAGDEVLRRFGALLRDTARPADLVGRMGGEEFALLLVDADMDRAYRVAEELRSGLEASRFPFLPAQHRLTASFGIAPREQGRNVRNMMKAADRQLYAAKAGGRNRIVAEGFDAKPLHSFEQIPSRT